GISRTLTDLSETVRAVTVLKNYGIRARRSCGGELGSLIDGFNDMIGAIQLRDAELERHGNNLEREVTSRTAELRKLNAQLMEARNKAEDGSRAKGEFLANMSHEIRTPMNGIIGITELAIESETDPEKRAGLLIVKQSADSL